MMLVSARQFIHLYKSTLTPGNLQSKMLFVFEKVLGTPISAP